MRRRCPAFFFSFSVFVCPSLACPAVCMYQCWELEVAGRQVDKVQGVMEVGGRGNQSLFFMPVR